MRKVLHLFQVFGLLLMASSIFFLPQSRRRVFRDVPAVGI